MIGGIDPGISLCMILANRSVLIGVMAKLASVLAVKVSIHDGNVAYPLLEQY